MPLAPSVLNTFDIIDHVPSVAKATNDTMVVAYPAGKAAANYKTTGHTMWVDAHQKLYAVGASNFSVSFSTDITVTYLGSTPIPAGTQVRFQFDVLDPGNVSTGRGGDKQAAIASLTDNSGGTASDTIPAVTGSYVEATMENIVASLAAKINLILARMRTAGLIDT